MDSTGTETQLASSAGTRVNTIVLAFTAIAGIFVFLRLFARFILTRVSGFDDVCIILAMGLSIGLTATISEQTIHGLGRHNAQLSAAERLALLKAFWASICIYSLALTTTKISILVQYLRIFPVHRFRNGCYILLGTVIVYGTWAIFGNIFLCNPILFSRDEPIGSGNCRDCLAIWYSNASVNIAQDLGILLLPMPLIQTLRIPRTQKRGLAVMIALGASASIVSAIRLYTIDTVAKSNDLSFDNTAHATISAVEVNVGIICACLPAMRPLLALMMPNYFSVAAQYTDVPDKLDIELAPPLEHTQTASVHMQSEITQTKMTRTNTSITRTPQIPRPTLSRTPSGRFTIYDSRPGTSNRAATPFQASHSRSGSNISIEIAAADARSNTARLQGRINPLRMSPITPLSPRNSSLPLFVPEDYVEYSFNASGIVTPGSLQCPQTPIANKALPLTPLPIGVSD